MALGSQDHELVGSTGISQAKDSLKKKRSLTRLFTSRSKQPSKSQSTPASPQTPVTPKIPGHFFSESSCPSPRSSAGPTSSIEFANELERQHNPERSPSEKTSSARNRVSKPQTPHGKAPDVPQDARVTPTNFSNGIETEKVESHRRSRRHRDQQSATSQSLLYRNSHSSLRPSVASRDSRSRGVSASLHNANVGPSIVTRARPKTAVGQVTLLTGHTEVHDSVEQLPTEPASSMPNVWHRMHGMEDHRASFRSALSHTSSGLNDPSTSRSSVVTRRTSLSDSTVEIYETANPKDGSMTVDDAINLYVTGFADDSGSEKGVVENNSMIADERRRSARIAEAMNDNMGSGLLSVNWPSTSASHSSAVDAALKEALEYPPLLPPTSTRDHYGFLKASHHVTLDQYEAWSLSYAPTQERRVMKWHAYMRKSNLTSSTPTEFPQRSAKTQRHIRKGVPPAWRGAAWFHYAGGKAYLEEHPNVYENLLARSSTSALGEHEKEIIERDLHRTFPDNVRFKPEKSRASSDPIELPLLSSLRNLLRAFSLHAPKIGYCQSLNFIGGLLLLFLPEEKAFWMLHIITTELLPQTHEVSLEGANVDLWVLMVALKESLPGVWARVASGEDGTGILGTKLPPISLCTTSWFMSLFIGTLPIECVLRVWDVLFYEGSKTLFRVALAVFKIGEQRLRDLSDSMEMFQLVQSLPRGLLDVGLLMDVALRRGGVSQDWVEKKRSERRQWYANERAKLSTAVVPNINPKEGETTKPRRAETLWRRRRK